MDGDHAQHLLNSHATFSAEFKIPSQTVGTMPLLPPPTTSPLPLSLDTHLTAKGVLTLMISLTTVTCLSGVFLSASPISTQWPVCFGTRQKRSDREGGLNLPISPLGSSTLDGHHGLTPPFSLFSYRPPIGHQTQLIIIAPNRGLYKLVACRLSPSSHSLGTASSNVLHVCNHFV